MKTGLPARAFAPGSENGSRVTGTASVKRWHKGRGSAHSLRRLWRDQNVSERGVSIARSHTSRAALHSRGHGFTAPGHIETAGTDCVYGTSATIVMVADLYAEVLHDADFAVLLYGSSEPTRFQGNHKA
jgi:hypothetical protein